MSERNGSREGFTFNRSLHIEQREESLTANAGAVVVRSLFERITKGCTNLARLCRRRRKYRVGHSDEKYLRVLIGLKVLGYDRLADVDALRADPALRAAFSDRRGESAVEDPLPSKSSLARWIRRAATGPRIANLEGLLVEQAANAIQAEGRKPASVVLDIDSAPIESHGLLGGSAYNGHYRTRCFHPLFIMLGKEGHLVAADLRPGNVSSSEGGSELLVATIERVQQSIAPVRLVRGDSGFMRPKLLEALESLKRPPEYIFRVNRNSVLTKLGEPWLRRPPGPRPQEPREWVAEVEYKAARWKSARRVIVVTVERPGELFLHQFYLVTNSKKPAEQILALYRQRGTAEARLGEWKTALPPTLSCTSRQRGEKTQEDLDQAFAANRVMFLISALAYNSLHLMRRMEGVPSKKVSGDGGVSLERARRMLLTIPGRIIRTGRRIKMLIPRGLAARLVRLVDRIEAQLATATA
jgi:hypothetical protein